MEAIRTLFDYGARDTEPVLPPEMRQLYDGDLNFPGVSEQRPYVIANFENTVTPQIHLSILPVVSGTQAGVY